MPLVPCPECGQQVSTLAAACPHCGAPRAVNSPTTSILHEDVSRGLIFGVSLLALVMVALGAVAFIPSRASAPAAAATAPPPAMPTTAAPTGHYYTWHRNGFYGYEFEQSEFAREHGQAAPVITYQFEGERAGVYHLRQFNGRFIDAISCRLPCDTVHIRNAQIDQDLPLRPQTALWAAVQDMVSGQLEVSK